MTDWGKLSQVGQQKLISALPRGGGEPGTRFAFKIKKVVWEDGKYCMDVVVRTPDLAIILASKRWDLYPSMLPEDIQHAIDYDVYDDSWFICESEINPNSRANRNRFKLLDTQGGLASEPGRDGSGPSKPAAVSMSPGLPRPGETETESGSERGQPRMERGAEELVEIVKKFSPQPRAGGVQAYVDENEVVQPAEPPAACPHTEARLIDDCVHDKGFYCKDCGERVG